MKIKIEIPESINDITLGQYQKFMKLTNLGEDKKPDLDFVNRKALEIFYNIDAKHFNNMKVKDVELIMTALNTALSEKIKLVNRFVMGEVEYGLIPDFDDMTFGEFVDLDKYSKLEDYHKLMSILYRPVIKAHKSMYNIVPYDGADSKMAAMPLGVALSCMDFFLTIGVQLTIDTLKSSKPQGEQLKKKVDLTISGLGTVLSTPYRVTM